MSKVSLTSISLALLALLFVLDPSLDFGRSLGPVWFTALVVTIVSSVVYSALLWSAIKDFAYPKASEAVSATVIAVMAALTGASVYLAADSEFEISRELTVAKIEYFCVDKFKGKECIRLVTGNPKYALSVPKWKRNHAVAKLKAYGQAR